MLPAFFVVVRVASAARVLPWAMSPVASWNVVSAGSERSGAGSVRMLCEAVVPFTVFPSTEGSADVSLTLLQPLSSMPHRSRTVRSMAEAHRHPQLLYFIWKFYLTSETLSRAMSPLAISWKPPASICCG